MPARVITAARNHPLTALLVVVGAAAILWAAARPATLAPAPADEDGTSSVVGWREVDPAPWPTRAIDGVEPVNVADATPDLAEGAVLVNFWASWCEPCREEMPALQELDDAGTVRVVGVSRDTDADVSAATLSEFGVTYENVIDLDSRLSTRFADLVPASAVPSSLLLVDGTVRWVHIGAFSSLDDLASQVRDLLAGRGA